MSIDIGEMLRLDVSAVELAVRTSVIYLLLVTAMRVVTRREMGALELPDLLMIVLIADGVQNGLAGQYQSLTGALIVAGTLIGWNYMLDALAYRFAFFRKLLRPAPLKLVENGRMLRHNMRRELVTVDELHHQLRTHGIEDLRDVKVAYLEPDGELSVITFDRAGVQERGAGEQGSRSGLA